MKGWNLIIDSRLFKYMLVINVNLIIAPFQGCFLVRFFIFDIFTTADISNYVFV